MCCNSSEMRKQILLSSTELSWQLSDNYLYDKLSSTPTTQAGLKTDADQKRLDKKLVRVMCLKGLRRFTCIIQ